MEAQATRLHIQDARLRHAGRHAAIFEGAGGVFAFVLEEERIDAGVSCDPRQLVEIGIAFHAADDLVVADASG